VSEPELMERIYFQTQVSCGGRPCIRDTRIEIAVILDGLAEGMTNGDYDHSRKLTKIYHASTQPTCRRPWRMRASGKTGTLQWKLKLDEKSPVISNRF